MSTMLCYEPRRLARAQPARPVRVLFHKLGEARARATRAVRADERVCLRGRRAQQPPLEAVLLRRRRLILHYLGCIKALYYVLYIVDGACCTARHCAAATAPPSSLRRHRHRRRHHAAPRVARPDYARRAYGAACVAFAMAWQLFTAFSPPSLDGGAVKEEPAAAEGGGEKPAAWDVSILRLLLTPPQQSCMWVQVGLPRARPPCRFARPLIHFTPNSLIYSAPGE